MTYEELHEEFSACHYGIRWFEYLLNLGEPYYQEFATERKRDMEEFLVKLKKEYPDEFLLWKMSKKENENTY